jgi:hypothetical protein
MGGYGVDLFGSEQGLLAGPRQVGKFSYPVNLKMEVDLKPRVLFLCEDLWLDEVKMMSLKVM